MPEKVYVKTPEEYLAAYHNGTKYVFLYYEGDKEELPVYLAQKSAEGDPHAMYLYSWHFFRLSGEHYSKKLHDRTLGRDEYGPKGFVYLRAAAEAGVPDAITEYEQYKQYYTYPIFQYTLPAFNPHNDYVNEKLAYEKTQKEQAKQPLDYNAYILEKLKKLNIEKGLKTTPTPRQTTVQMTPSSAAASATVNPAEQSLATKKQPTQTAEKPSAKRTSAKKPSAKVENFAPPREKTGDPETKRQETAAPVKVSKQSAPSTPKTETVDQPPATQEKRKYTPGEIYTAGVCCYNGNKVSQDYVKALKLFKQAAKLGVVEALTSCGTCYEFGRGCEKDYVTAMEYYRAAMEKGNAKAAWRLGFLTATFACEYEKGIRLMEKGYEQGALAAAFDLGQVYSAKNPFFSVEKAAFWFERAAQAGYKNAYEQLGWLYEKEVKTDEAKRKAIEWYKKAYESGDEKVALQIGMLMTGYGATCAENAEGYEWLKKALQKGNTTAVDLMRILDNNRCPHCRAIYSKTYKKGLFGERCVCSKCGKKIKEK
ncbi:MAG: SEL1-like repeat protein [Clostridia bacterium]|nr:SEL1-like repeat protein [Clostridia bacterium]